MFSSMAIAITAPCTELNPREIFESAAKPRFQKFDFGNKNC